MAFWMAARFVRASGYPGMKVLTGVNAMMEKTMADSITMKLTIATKNSVLVNITERRCLSLVSSVSLSLKIPLCFRLFMSSL